jgi:hypothetical protein
VVSPDGRLIFAISLIQPSDGSRQGMIVTADLSGKVLSKSSLGTYTASHMCAASDGTIWTLGQDWVDDKRAASQQPALLRNYARTGVLISSHLSGAVLSGGQMNLRPRGKTFGISVTDAHISCGSSSVGVYVMVNGQHYWYEVPTRSGVPRLWQMAPPAVSGTMTGLVLFSEHSAYASIISRSASGRKRGLYRLSLSKQGDARWVHFPLGGMPKDEDRGETLIGAQASSLVFMIGSIKPRAMNPVLYWYDPTRATSR